MSIWELMAIIIGTIAAIITIVIFIHPKIKEILERIIMIFNTVYIEKITNPEILTQEFKFFFPKEERNIIPRYKILECRSIKIFQLDMQESIDDNNTITFFTAKKYADRKSKIWHNDSKLVYSTLTSYDIFARTKGELNVRTYSWAYVYGREKNKGQFLSHNRDKEFLLIHVGNDLKPIGHYYSWDSWAETEKKYFSKIPFISEEDLRIDSDQVYEIAEKNDVFLYRGTLVLSSVNILDRYGPYWVLNGRYFINPKTGKLIDGYSESERPHEIKIDDKVYYTITYEETIHLQHGITFNREVDFKKGNILLDEYERWTNVYEYEHQSNIMSLLSNIVGIAIKARTVDKTDNRVLATMEIIKFGDGKIVFSEKHLDKTGNITYDGSGEINTANGFKQKEQAISGKKIFEYYHAWPVGKKN